MAFNYLQYEIALLKWQVGEHITEITLKSIFINLHKSSACEKAIHYCTGNNADRYEK